MLDAKIPSLGLPSEDLEGFQAGPPPPLRGFGEHPSPRITSDRARHPELVYFRDLPSFAASPLRRASFAWDRERRMAERVGFATLPDVENKELKAFRLPHDPPDPHESPVETRIEHVDSSRVDRLRQP